MNETIARSPLRPEPTVGSARERPRSVTNGYINFLGLFSALAALFLMMGSSLDATLAALIVAAAVAVPIIAGEVAFLKVHLRPTTGLNFAAARAGIDLRRVATKLLGLFETLLVLALVYWVFPEYRQPLYRPFFAIAVPALPGFLLLAVPYFPRISP